MTRKGGIDSGLRLSALLDDMLLHSEPDHPFFEVPRVGSVTLTPLSGVVRLSGDEHFLVD